MTNYCFICCSGDATSVPIDHKALLLQTLALVSHEPLVPLYRYACHALALQCVAEARHSEAGRTKTIQHGKRTTMASREMIEAVYYLAEAQATTFRHSAILTITKKLR